MTMYDDVVNALEPVMVKHDIDDIEPILASVLEIAWVRFGQEKAAAMFYQAGDELATQGKSYDG